LSLKDKCDEELIKVRTQLRVKGEKQQQAEQHWTEAWRIISGTKNNGKASSNIVVGYASANQQPAQLQEVLPHSVSSDGSNENIIGWPVVMLYPQYSQIDVIQGVDASDMLAIHLAEMFPEIADMESRDGSLAVSWDRDREYEVSNLVVYAPLEAAPRIHTLNEWLDSCREQSAMRGELDSRSCESALEVAKKRSAAHERKLSTFKATSKESNSNNSSSTVSNNNHNVEFSRVGYLDVHLGCTFRDVLTSPGHVLAGGLLTLLIFVRGNEAHAKFLRDTAGIGRGIWPLSPS
jgi:Cns1/TTC4 Wheel domain